MVYFATVSCSVILFCRISVSRWNFQRNIFKYCFHHRMAHTMS